MGLGNRMAGCFSFRSQWWAANEAGDKTWNESKYAWMNNASRKDSRNTARRFSAAVRTRQYLSITALRIGVGMAGCFNAPSRRTT